ncbi:MAG TPA: ATP-binding protein [Gemmataceae bacterium]|jgi:PAS domain S-box-containing protein
MTTLTIDQLLRENEALRRRLEEAENALDALRAGEVDAILVDSQGEQVYTLESADKPYRLLVEQIPYAAATLTAEGAIIHGNRRFADLLREPLATLLGKPIHDFVAPESEPILKTLLCDGENAEIQGEVVLRRGDGTPLPTHLGVRLVQEGAFGSCLLVRDLTEQRRYQELQRMQTELCESEARLAAELADTKLLQSISAQLIQEDKVETLYEQILEAAIAVMHSDMASMQMLDPDRGQLRLLAWKGFDAESAASWEWVRLGSATSCGAALASGERVIIPDIETCDFLAGTPNLDAYRRSEIRGMQSTPLVSRSGRILGMISTHWRRPHQPSERDLRLLDVLARQAADLLERKQAEQALRDADRKKDEFLATLAHELRNPLAPIRNAVQILKANGPPHSELDWARGVLERQLQLMARLLEDLLDVSRISRGKLELRKERVELAAVARAALETSRPVIEACGHELTVTLPSETIHLEADPVRLAQVFGNLLNNAAKYTEERGRIELTAERQGSDVIVSVKDTGIGIRADMLSRVFEIFSQSERARVRAQGGLGVGLSLVKGLVELHGGGIEARSEGPDRGSEFVVRLPIAVETPLREPAQSSAEDEQQSVTGCRILIVDDNRDSADSLAVLLKVMGNEVGTAYDGEQAVEAAATLRPDVVLLDIGMPKVNGYEACRRIRQQPWGQGMFLIALTGWGQEEDRRRTEQAGFDRHMVKPVEPAALMKLLTSLSSESGGRFTQR